MEHFKMNKSLTVCDQHVTSYIMRTMLALLLFTLGGLEYLYSTELDDERTLKNEIVILKTDQQLITGTVTDVNGAPLPGTSVTEKNTLNGVQTDFDGNFSIPVDDPNATLVFSYIGFSTKEIPLNGTTQLDVVLEEDAQTLDEVVVVGYGTQSREKLTTSVSKLDNEVLEYVPYANAASAIQGTVSGVRVQTATGQPGAAPRIIVRGGTSINNPNGAAPLYVVDGVIRSDMDNISPDDIESLQVLKDAASTSIYGARGSNGVVVITTKSGKTGRTKISYKYSMTASEVWKKYDLVSARDFIKFYRQGVLAAAEKTPARLSLLSAPTAGGTGNDLTRFTSFTTQYLTPENAHKLDEGWESMPDPVDPSQTLIFKDTNWQDILYRTGYSQNHSLSFSGGTEKSNFYLGLGYLNNEGTALGTDYKRFSVNLNADFKIRDNFSVFGRLLFSKNQQNGGQWDYERGQAYAPTAKYLLEDGTLAPGGHSRYPNPEHLVNSQNNKNTEDNLTIAVGSSWEFLPGFSFQPQVSIFTTSINERTFQEAAYLNGPNGYVDSRQATGLHSDNIQYQADAVLSYDADFGNSGHNLSFKGGLSYFEREFNLLDAVGQGAASDLIPTLNASSTPISVNGIESEQVIMGYFGRLNYDFDYKYLLSISARYDGASNLGKNYKWGFFPGISAGWNLHHEEFWPENPKLVSKLKLRASYGINGNISGLGDYESQGEYSVGEIYGGNSAVTNSVLANPELQWERSKTLNFGIDAGLFKNRINFMVDVYRRVTDNLLTNLPLPPSTGFENVRTNLGSLENKGIDIEASFQVLPNRSKFQWNAAVNASYVENKILKLPDNGIENNRLGGYNLWDPSISDYNWFGGLQEGGTLGELYGYKQLGIYATDEAAQQAPVDMIITTTDKTKYGGDVNWLDSDGNNIIDTRDRVYMGNIYPKWTGGISNNFSFANFSLGVRMDYTLGHTIYNWSRALILAQYGTRSGITTDVLRSWQNQGDVTDIPRYYWADQTTQRNIARGQGTIDEGNSEFYESGDFLCLREITLSYSLPDDIIGLWGISDLKLNLTGNNLYYFTGYSGLSPEDGGQDFGGYPPPRNIILGLNVSF